MYIDILLALAFFVSTYFLRQRLMAKIPDLALIPDQDLSVLLEENTAKLQLFFVHLFHFRSFYRERHYHEKVHIIIVKLLYKIHIVMLRMDNRLVGMIQRIRAANEQTVLQKNDNHEQVNSLPVHVQVQEEVAQMPEKINRVQEVRSHRRVSFAGVSRSRRNNPVKATLMNDRTLPQETV